MKNRSFKQQKKGAHPYPNRKPSKRERKPGRIYPGREQEQELSPENTKPSRGYPPSLSRGSPGRVYIEEITVYYSLN